MIQPCKPNPPSPAKGMVPPVPCAWGWVPLPSVSGGCVWMCGAGPCS